MIGAAEKTRTSTPVKEQRPQRCASTNSATAAHQGATRLAKSIQLVKPVFTVLNIKYPYSNDGNAKELDVKNFDRAMPQIMSAIFKLAVGRKWKCMAPSKPRYTHQ